MPTIADTTLSDLAALPDLEEIADAFVGSVVWEFRHAVTKGKPKRFYRVLWSTSGSGGFTQWGTYPAGVSQPTFGERGNHKAYSKLAAVDQYDSQTWQNGYTQALTFRFRAPAHPNWDDVIARAARAAQHPEMRVP